MGIKWGVIMFKKTKNTLLKIVGILVSIGAIVKIEAMDKNNPFKYNSTSINLPINRGYQVFGNPSNSINTDQSNPQNIQRDALQVLMNRGQNYGSLGNINGRGTVSLLPSSRPHYITSQNTNSTIESLAEYSNASKQKHYVETNINIDASESLQSFNVENFIKKDNQHYEFINDETKDIFGNVCHKGKNQTVRPTEGVLYEKAEKIRKSLAPFAGFLFRVNNISDEQTYKDYLNFVENVIGMSRHFFDLPNDMPYAEKYHFGYLVNAINHLLFNSDGSLKNFKQEEVMEKISHQIAIYLKSTLSEEDYKETTRYLASQNAPYFYDIAHSHVDLKDSHPSLGWFRTKDAYLDHAESFAQKIVNKQNRELHYLIDKLKPEASFNYTNNLKAVNEKFKDGQSLIDKFPENKLLKIVYNARYINKPAFCIYDPKISQINCSDACDRYKGVASLIKQLNINSQNLNPELIKYLYELNDQTHNNFTAALDILTNASSDNATILKNSIQNFPALKTKYEYFKQMHSGKADSSNFKYLYEAMSQALDDFKYDQTIIGCENFSRCPQATEKQILNHAEIIKIAGKACNAICSKRDTVLASQAVKELKLANFLHKQNQDPTNESIVADNIQTLIKVKNAHLENWSENARDLCSKLLDNVYTAAELAFSEPNHLPSDWTLTTALNCSLAGLESLSSAQAKIEEGKSWLSTMSDLVAEARDAYMDSVEKESQKQINFAKNTDKLGNSLLKIFTANKERNQKLRISIEQNPQLSEEVKVWADQAAKEGLLEAIVEFLPGLIDMPKNVATASKYITKFVLQLDLDHEVWLDQNKTMLDKLNDIERAIRNSSDKDFVWGKNKILTRFLTDTILNKAAFGLLQKILGYGISSIKAIDKNKFSGIEVFDLDKRKFVSLTLSELERKNLSRALPSIPETSVILAKPEELIVYSVVKQTENALLAKSLIDKTGKIAQPINQVAAVIGISKAIKKTVEDLIKESKHIETKRFAKIFEKSGGFDEAFRDFESLDVVDIKDISTGKIGILPDGRDVNVRIKSKDGRSTLEIYDRKTKKSIKIRYGAK